MRERIGNIFRYTTDNTVDGLSGEKRRMVQGLKIYLPVFRTHFEYRRSRRRSRRRREAEDEEDDDN